MFGPTEPIFLVSSKISGLSQAILNAIYLDALMDLKYSICSWSYSSTKADTRFWILPESFYNWEEDVSFLIIIYKEISGTLLLKNFPALNDIL